MEPIMLNLPCANKCGNKARGVSAYCSDSCRAKASHQRNYVRKRKVHVPDGTPLCWCGKPAKFKDGDRPKCGNHSNSHRADKNRWRKLLKEIQGSMTIDEAREFWDLARAHKLAVDIQDGKA